MKSAQALLISITISGMIACKSNQKTTADAPATTTSTVPVANNSQTVANNPLTIPNKVRVQTDSVTPAIYRVAVSFISFGAGTDPDGRPMLDTYVQQYMDASEKKIVYDAHPWGREGEVDFCFTLDNLTAEEQKIFIEGLKSTFKGRELVHVEENKTNNYRR